MEGAVYASGWLCGLEELPDALEQLGLNLLGNSGPAVRGGRQADDQYGPALVRGQ